MARRDHLRRVLPWALAVGVLVGPVLATGCTAGSGGDGATSVTTGSTPGGGSLAPVPPTEVPPAPIPATPAAAAPPGTLIDATAIAAPAGARAWHLAYHSTDAAGRDIAVTGTLVVPDHPAPGSPLVTWAHPTTGSADTCAPSTRGTTDLPLLESLLARGWSVVGTDYEGLGTTAAHPYLVGASEGHAVLDAARAVPAVAGAGVAAGGPVAVWGFSQGGHAAAFAGQLASSYAPDLAIAGVALAAPVSDVAGFARRAETIPSQFGVLVTIVGGLAAAYPDVDPATVLTPAAAADLGELERRCIGDINILFDRPIGPQLAAPTAEVPAVAARLAENEAGLAPIGAPVLVVQGDLDDIVDPAATAALVGRYCALGATVESVVVPDVRHGVMADQPFLDWTAARFAGEPAPQGCLP